MILDELDSVVVVVLKIKGYPKKSPTNRLKLLKEQGNDIRT